VQAKLQRCRGAETQVSGCKEAQKYIVCAGDFAGDFAGAGAGAEVHIWRCRGDDAMVSSRGAEVQIQIWRRF
jgi:hypothetical protein